MYQIVYSLEAEDDLAEIVYYYLVEGGSILAEKMLERMTGTLASLNSYPHRAVESQKIADTREFKLGNLPYKAFLIIEESSKQVKILRIVHTSRRFPNAE